MRCSACDRIPPIQKGRRDRPGEAPATFPQSMPAVNGEAYHVVPAKPVPSSKAASARFVAQREQDTRPGLLLRSAHHRRELRYVLHRRSLEHLQLTVDTVLPAVEGCRRGPRLLLACVPRARLAATVERGTVGCKAFPEYCAPRRHAGPDQPIRQTPD